MFFSEIDKLKLKLKCLTDENNGSNFEKTFNLWTFFEYEKIMPDFVCKLSMQEMKYFRINNSQDMMKLRLECIKVGEKHRSP
jgi:hypothetical protein